MEGRIQDAMGCSEFDQLLTEALDGALTGASLERFEAHKGSCAVCRQMFAEVQAGMNWMQALPEVDPPARLIQNILDETTGTLAKPAPAEQTGWWAGVREWARPVWEPALQPRFAMSAATAFFSVTLMLNIAGVRLGTVKGSDLKPSSVIAGISQLAGETQGRVVKYYENLRFVYEIESKVQQLKNATEQNAKPDSNQQQKQDEQKKKDDTSGQPQRHEERYSLGVGEGILATVAAPWNSDSVLAVLDRRNP